jgi:hypothetical protein
MKRTNIYLSDVQHKKLKAMSKKTGIKLSEIVRRMIDEGFRKYEETKDWLPGRVGGDIKLQVNPSSKSKKSG